MNSKDLHFSFIAIQWMFILSISLFLLFGERRIFMNFFFLFKGEVKGMEPTLLYKNNAEDKKKFP